MKTTFVRKFLIRILLSILTILVLVAPATVAARSVSVPVDEVAKTRGQAEWQALVTAMQRAMKVFMDDQAMDDSVTVWIEKELKKLEPRNYKPLVTRWKLEVDEAHKGRHYLEGKVVLDRDRLQLLATSRIKDLTDSSEGKEAALQTRLSLYIMPVGLDETELTQSELRLRKELKYALQQRLDRSGYTIKNEQQKNDAQFLLKLADAEADRRGLIGSMAFTVEILENRADGSILATAYGEADASLGTTELALRKELFKRSSVKVAAEVHRKLEQILRLRTEIVFYTPRDMKKRQVKRADDDVFDGLATLYGAESDSEYEAFETAVNGETFKKDDRYAISFMIPADYEIPRNRLEEELKSLHQELFASEVPEIKLASAGKRYLVFDAQDPPAELVPAAGVRTVSVEALIRAGKLDSPPGVGANALDTVRAQLRDRPGDRKSVEYLGRIADLFVRQAYDAVEREQLARANRYLDRAEYVLGSHDEESLSSARQAIEQARAKLVTATPDPVPAGRKTAAKTRQNSVPEIVFPELEARLRGLSRKKAAQVMALAAAPKGIDRIVANAEELEFVPVSGTYQGYLDLPGADTQQFEISVALANSRGRIEIQVTDTRGKQVKRTLEIKNGRPQIVSDMRSREGKKVVDKGRYWALLIGNQNYTNGVPPLATPHHDVDHLKEVLVRTYGFDSGRVLVVKDATRDQMLKALDKMHDQVKGNDSLLIYYAGHGYQDKGFGGKGFWIPVDGISPEATEESPRTSWLPNSQVHDILEASRAKHILLISDSCYSGTFKTRSIGERDAFAANMDFFYGLAAKDSRRAITSGDLEPVADGGAEGHSIFAYHVIKHLQQSGRTINAERLFQEIRGPVVNGSRQHPQYFTIQGAGDEGGDFLFIPRG